MKHLKAAFSQKGWVLIPMALLFSKGLAAEAERKFQPLHIPEAISGSSIQLSLHKSKKSFWEGATTATYAYNKESFWGPTLILNKGEKVDVQVKNDLDEPTTVHWHGLHIPAETDGGPHQLIKPGETWNPKFTVANNASTFWYHPHPHEQTQKQMAMGAGGLIIIRDSDEAKLALPRTYGVDDIPLVLTSRRFNLKQEFTYAGDDDKYGDFELVNGTLDPEVTLPKQFVRLRILNAEIERGYNLGFSDHRTFYLIGTDGGLVDKPIPLQQMKLMVGERAEILVDLSQDKSGATVDLMTFNANQPFGFPGGEPGQSPPNGGYLNNLDYRLLRINVGKSTSNPILALPDTLAHNQFWKDSDVTKRRMLHITGGGAPNKEFSFDQHYFDMHNVDQVIKLGSIEAWTVSNDRVFGHSFHIHDVQFKIVSRSDSKVEPYEEGWKDTVYVPRNTSVTFLAKFDDFASDTNAYMYHCHMANHEDGGLMGQFLVVKDVKSNLTTFRLPANHEATEQMSKIALSSVGKLAPPIIGPSAKGEDINYNETIKTKPVIAFFIESGCPCSKDATEFMNRIQVGFGKSCQIIGVINGDQRAASAWTKAVGAKFPVIADKDYSIITSFGAKSSVTISVIAQGGRIEKTYLGYGQEMLKDLSARLTKLSGSESKVINFKDAPKELVVGCPFNLPKGSK